MKLHVILQSSYIQVQRIGAEEMNSLPNKQVFIISLVYLEGSISKIDYTAVSTI
jgi:hypothetical protein